MPEKCYHDQLKSLLNTFVHNVYKVTKSFPKDELYGVTSQIRRSSLSVILNYIEGYARNSTKMDKNFLKYAYGSSKEVEYLIEFSYEEKYLGKGNYQVLKNQADRIGGMLFGIMKNIK